MSIADEIQKLQQLRQSGAINDEEFAAAKARLLGGSAGVQPSAEEPILLSPAAQEKQARQWAFALHLSVVAGAVVPPVGYIAPILIWQLKKADVPGLDVHGRNAVNWIISELIYSLVCLPFLCVPVIGLPLLIAVKIVGMVLPVIAAIKANNGEVWKYPLAIPFLK